MFPLLALVFIGSLGFGWGRPVQVQPHAFSRRFTMRTGHLIVAAAGPLMNVVFGVCIASVHALLLHLGFIEPVFEGGRVPRTLHEVLLYAAMLNFILFFFNLIPAAPLDGGTVLRGLLPHRYVDGYDKFSVFGPFILMLVIFEQRVALIFLWPAVQVWHGLESLLGVVHLTPTF